MNLLKGKSEEDIMDEFKSKYKISNFDWDNMIKYIKRPKLGKHFVLVWGLPFIMIGICFIVTVISALTREQFPFIFSEMGFITRFVNIIEVAFMISGGLFCVIFPFFRFADVYEWE